jgi:hypothetical protein
MVIPLQFFTSTKSIHVLVKHLGNNGFSSGESGDCKVRIYSETQLVDRKCMESGHQLHLIAGRREMAWRLSRQKDLSRETVVWFVVSPPSVSRYRNTVSRFG